MENRDALADGMEVVGQLSVLVDNIPVNIEFQGDSIGIFLSGLSESLDLFRRFSRGDRRKYARRIQAVLRRSKLDLFVIADGNQIARLPVVPSRNWGGRLFGVEPFELSFRSILICLLNRMK
jgi:hypothetical protein